MVRFAGRQPSLVRRVFLSLAIVSSLAAVIALGISVAIYQSSVLQDASDTLAGECRLVAGALGGSSDVPSRVVGLDLGDTRMTVIAPDGTVLFDNVEGAATMPNHADRPEVAEALRLGEASSQRESETVGYVSIYHALRLADGGVVRLSVDRESALSSFMGDFGVVALVLLGVVIACWVVARLWSQVLMRPVLDLDPAEPDPEATYVELGPLLARISEQQERLAEQVRQLRGADLMRREFTSNVTHELKTPLASISGAAELIRAGIARPEDVPEFAGRIYDEAGHMTELVNDILTLSKLDESERTQDRTMVGTEEPVDLLRLARDAAGRLSGAAEASGVTIGVEGPGAMVRGVTRLLDELVSNLCSNAVRYNRPGGSVRVWVGVAESRAVLRVSDTGIGIPAEAQAKVFERFYRVDASRSKDRGGTGLGLAIVKHAAVYHGASVDLASKVGEGTTFTVTFPAESLVAAG